jgi:hypothetical protein
MNGLSCLQSVYSLDMTSIEYLNAGLANALHRDAHVDRKNS